MQTTKGIGRASEWLRAGPARGIKDPATAIQRNGGDRDAGLILGLAVVTRGEALGHHLWLDGEFLQQTAAAINQAKTGIKSRFTHPSLSGDGLGTYLGRMKNARIDGDVVRADLHFSDVAHNTSDGDRAAYVMDLAEEDPVAFGVSIAYRPDYGAEDKFWATHEDKDGNFESPDSDNTGNLPHARLNELRASDVVDEPAANPNGLFHRGDEIAAEADALLSYSLGLSDQAPELVELEVNAERVSAFVSRWLDQHGLEIIQTQSAENGEKGMPDMAGTKKSDAVQMSQEEFDAALAEARAEATRTIVQGHIEALSKAAEEAEAKLTAAVTEAQGLAAKQQEKAVADAQKTTEQETITRVSDILDRCQLAQRDLAFAAGVIGLSVDEVKDKLIASLTKDNQAVGDGGGSDLGEKKTPEDLLRKEFRDGGGEAVTGVTEEEYVASGLRDLAGGVIS